MSKLEIEVPEGKKAVWKTSFFQNGEQQTYLTLVDADEKSEKKPKKDKRPVTERIKTFEDAYNELCERNDDVSQMLVDEYDDLEQKPSTKDLRAYIKLRIIVSALNEGWQPTFATSEYRYLPYFYGYTKEEVDKMDDEQKEELWLFGGSSDNGSNCGLATARSNIAWADSDAYFSSRLAFKSRELAIYCGKQFIDIWADYVFL